MDSFIPFIFLIVIVSIFSFFIVKLLKKNKITSEKEITVIRNSEDIGVHEEKDDEPICEIIPYNQFNIDEYKSSSKSLKLTDTLKRQVENIIKLAPNTKDIIKNEKQVVIQFNKDIMQKFKTGELQLMKKKNSLNEFRTIAVDGKNKIRAHGWEEIKEIKKINPAQLANLAFGAMTIITAQEHLDKINKQLSKMDGKVDQLVRHISQEKRGGIQGNIKYLKTIMPDIQAGSYGFESENYNSIERIVNETYKEVQTFINKIDDIIVELNNVESKAQFKADSLLYTMQTISKRFNESLELCYGNLEVMNICLSLKMGILSDSQSNETRINDIENYLSHLSKLEDKFFATFNKKIDSLEVKFNIRLKPEVYIENKKVYLQVELDYLKDRINQNKTELIQSSQILKRNVGLIENPVDLKVEYDNQGNILAIHKLERTK